MTTAIHIEDLRKTYPRSWSSPAFEAVRGISLSVGEGEVFGFIGPNGAGKSTTIKILTGVMAQSSGRAEIFGIDVALPEARRGLGYVPENPSLPDYLTPMEILSMGLDLHQSKVIRRREHCMRWLDRFGLASVANKVVRGFSKGMAQRTVLAHAMVIQPRLLILDEPLSGLDPVGRRDIVEILSEFRQQGGTIFFTSHVLHDVERIADHFGLIHKGELLTIRSPQAVVADQADRYVVRYRGSDSVAGGTQIRSGLFAVETQALALTSVIAEVQAAGFIVQDIQPAASLETVFFRTIDEPSKATA